MKFSLVALFVLNVHALYYEFPFYNPNGGFEGSQVRAHIGIPEQEIMLNLTFYNYCPGFSVYSKKNHEDGFDSSASTTFKKTGDHKDGANVDGIVGTDQFAVVDRDGISQNFMNAPISVIDSGICGDRSVLSLTHSDALNKNEFWDYIFEDYEKKMLVITYDRVARYAGDFSMGAVSFGHLPNNCVNLWKSFPEVEDLLGPQWSFEVKAFEVGKFSASQPGTARFDIDSVVFQLPPEIYDQVEKELDIRDNLIRCNTTKSIIFTLPNYGDLYMTANNYVDIRYPLNGYCPFFGFRGVESQKFTLPSSLLSNRCLMLDFGEKTIGLAHKVS